MRRVTNLSGKLLEGCIWEEVEQMLYFVDIDSRIIYRFDPESAKVFRIEMHTWVSCVAAAREGGLIAGLADGLYRVDVETGRYEKILDSGLGSGYRYNDGKCDRFGRLWIGSMAMTPRERKMCEGCLYCIGDQGVEQMYGGFSIPNGLCWNRSGSKLYHIDTPRRRVDTYDVADGIYLKNRTTVAELAGEEGVPDGMCMDVEGKLWVAMWGGGQILRCDPIGGGVLERFEVPDKNVSCCVFGGRDMDRLYVTTARDEDGKGGEVYEYEMQVKGVFSYRYGNETEKNSPDNRGGKGDRSADRKGDGQGRL